MWDEHFQELKSYKETHGNCDVPARHGSLGRWIYTQHQQYRLLKDGNQSPLSDDRICKLESIGFQWISERHDLWHRNFQELKK